MGIWSGAGRWGAHSARAEQCPASLPITQATHPDGFPLSPTGCPCVPAHAHGLRLLPQGLLARSACFPVCCHGDQICGDRRGWSLTLQQGCLPSRVGYPHPPALPLSPPGLGRGPSVKPLPQAVCWGCSICSDARIAAVSQTAHVRNGDSAILLPPALTGHPLLKARLCTGTDKLISVMITCLSSLGKAPSLQGQPHLPTTAAAGTAEDEERATLTHLPWAHPQDSCQAGCLSPNISALQ